MKILFVYPEFEKGGFKPMNISLLSGVLNKDKHSLRLFDTSMYEIPISGRVNDVSVAEELLIYPPTELPSIANKRINKRFDVAFIETLNEYEPELVAFSTTTIPYVIVENLVKAIDLKNRPALAIGGIHALACTKEVVDSRLFDYICIGEGEEAISGIVEHIAGNRASKDIPNVIVKENGEYVQNKILPLLTNLDELPYYDWSIYEEYHFWRPYQGTAYRMGDFMSSRGCSYKCLFCFYDTYFEFYEDEKRIRYYSPERCISEMDELTKRYNLTFWKFHDSDFFLRSEEKLGELLELYNTRIDLPFVCNTNANTVTNKKVALFNNANCKSVSMGVESGSERIRNEVLNKRVKNEKIIESIALLKDAGIRVCTSNMLGLPDETEDDIRETIQLNRNAAPTLAEPTYFYPFRGTKLGDLCYEKGYVKEHKGNLLNLRNHCVIEMPQISLDTLNGLFRTFPLYMNLPKWLDPIIRLAENHDNVGNKVYRTLHQIVQNKINECLNENQ